MKHLLLLSSIVLLTYGCTNKSSSNVTSGHTPLTPEQKKYWYDQQAEITSYDLTQARYGELYKGTSVLIYVTEPFSKETNTKPNQSSSSDIACLKLNFTKKFNTGIYPYSMMTSTFFPIENSEHSLKTSTSLQEWCGHSYKEIKTTDSKFKIKTESYFEGSSGTVKLSKDYLEDDFWSMIRLFPNEIPTGEQQIIPSMFYLSLMHKETKAYKCVVSNKKNNETSELKLSYPELKRSLSITYTTDYPYSIESWTETYESGWGESKKEMTTTAIKKKRMLSDYWNKHSLKDSALRDSLGLN